MTRRSPRSAPDEDGPTRPPPGEDQKRGTPGRQVPAQNLRPQPQCRGRRARAYKQLLEAERSFRDLKGVLLIAVFHYKDERIRAHILICFLALVIVRLPRQARTRPNLAQYPLRTRHDPPRTLHRPGRQFTQTTELTRTQRELHTALNVPELLHFGHITPA